MKDFNAVISETRESTANLLCECISNLEGKSEVEVRDTILKTLAQNEKIFSEGWYAPPPAGICVLCDTFPFERLKFDSLRKTIYWPSEESKFEKESVGIIYFSSVDKKTGMLGDIGFTVYKGDDLRIRKHVRDCYDILFEATKYAKVGMEFRELYTHCIELFQNKGKKIGWMTTVNDTSKTNLGHTVPGSFESDFRRSDSFEEVKNSITSKRIYVNAEEKFKIPPTCAFTLEARLTDLEEKLPNVFFHFIVTFSDGEKKVLTNFNKIFNVAEMPYML